MDSIQREIHLTTISAMFGSNLKSSSKKNDFFNEVPIWSNVELSLGVEAILVGGHGQQNVQMYNSDRGLFKDHFTIFWFQLSY